MRLSTFLETNPWYMMIVKSKNMIHILFELKINHRNIFTCLTHSL